MPNLHYQPNTPSLAPPIAIASPFFFFGFLWLYPLVSIESIELFALQLPGGLGYGDIGNHVVVAENVLDTTRFAGV